MLEGAVGGGHDIEAVRTHATALLGLMQLSSAMLGHDDADAILSMAAERVPALCACRLERSFLVRETELVGRPLSRNGRDAPLIAQLKDLNDGAGAVQVDGQRWAWAFPLTSLAGLCGYVVIGASQAPSADQQSLLAVLALITGAAVAAAVAHTRAADHERYSLVFELLARTVADQGGRGAIALALHRLTGRSVFVEDRHGNLTATAGPEPLPAHVKPTAERIAWRMRRLWRDRGPVRDGDLLVAPTAPHGQVLGALAIFDPERNATPYDLFALEQAALVLAVELFHQDRLAGVQLTVERDLVDDLLIGVDDAVAWSRGDAMGHDLHRPHCVLLLQWQDVSGDSLARAVEQVTRELGLDALWSRRDGMVVLLLEPSGDLDSQPRWTRLHGRVAAALGSTRGAIGVGAPAASPSALPRSFRQAGQSLAIRSRSRSPFGVTTFEELGVYRILARAESRADVEQFVEEWLGELIAYDRLHGSDMVDTLAEYCESGGNYDRTAQALGIHRSTLRYRLRRIRDISGRDLTGVDARFNLHVATRAWRVLGISG